MVLTLVTVTFAFGTLDPLGSVTVPVTSPEVIDCAFAFVIPITLMQALKIKMKKARSIVIIL